jgi:hypothetical protein
MGFSFQASSFQISGGVFFALSSVYNRLASLGLELAFPYFGWNTPGSGS